MKAAVNASTRTPTNPSFKVGKVLEKVFLNRYRWGLRWGLQGMKTNKRQQGSTCSFGGLPLRVVKIGWDCDDSLGDVAL